MRCSRGESTLFGPSARDAHPQLVPSQVSASLDALAEDFEVEEVEEDDPTKGFFDQDR